MPHDTTIPADALDLASRIIGPVLAISNHPIADQLGVLAAWEAAIETRRKELRAQVEAAGGRVEGTLFDAAIGAESVRTTVDRKAIEKDLGEAAVARWLKFTSCAGRLCVTPRKA